MHRFSNGKIKVASKIHRFLKKRNKIVSVWINFENNILSKTKIASHKKDVPITC